MRIRQIDNPDRPAEGRCNGVPYDTQLVNINGVNIHFWFNTPSLPDNAQETLHKAMNARDIVSATWSFGVPSEFWTHQDIE